MWETRWDIIIDRPTARCLCNKGQRYRGSSALSIICNVFATLKLHWQLSTIPSSFKIVKKHTWQDSVSDWPLCSDELHSRGWGRNGLALVSWIADTRMTRMIKTKCWLFQRLAFASCQDGSHDEYLAPIGGRTHCGGGEAIMNLPLFAFIEAFQDNV